MAYSDQELLEAIRALQSRLDQVLPGEQGRDLSGRLEGSLTQVEEPTRSSRAITLALETIRNYPAAFNELKAELVRQAGAKREDRLGMKMVDIIGDGGAVRPGERVVCPVDPRHLQKRLRVKGERCPQHNVELVAESGVEPPETKP
jgi:hypothetical protein